MRLHWKLLRLAVIPAALLLGTGCSGVNASGGVSPASFFLPGLIRAEPQPAHPQRELPIVEHGIEVAQF